MRVHVVLTGREGRRTMFLGTYRPRLDDKGRLILPAKFREQLADGLVMTKGQEHCLFVHRRDDFAQQVAKMQTAPSSVRAVRDHSRVYLSSATDEVPDRQGRITIPQTLRDYAKLDREVAVIGNGLRAEIWDAQAWDDYVTAAEQAFADQEVEVMPGFF